MSDPAYDGLCGIPCPSPLQDGRYVRCQFEFGHGGKHSWEKHMKRITIMGAGAAEKKT